MTQYKLLIIILYYYHYGIYVSGYVAYGSKVHLRSLAMQLDDHANSLRQQGTTRGLPPLSSCGIILSSYWDKVMRIFKYNVTLLKLCK